MNRCLLAHYGEITLKGKNQRQFQQLLVANIRQRLKAAGFSWPIRAMHGRLYIYLVASNAEDVALAMEVLGEVAGIDNIAAAVCLSAKQTAIRDQEVNWEIIEKTLLQIAETAYRPDTTFAVRVNRADKQVRIASPEMEKRLGHAIQQHTSWQQVRLKNPGLMFHVDIYPDGMYLYAGKRQAMGGLPTRSGGQVLSLLSGGIDSPVAAYQMAGRGCQMDFFHVAASHAEMNNIQDSVVAQLARLLSHFTLRSRLYVVPYTHFDFALAAHSTRFGLVLFRRFLGRLATLLAQRLGAQALVSGDSLGQVASQTLENLVSQSMALELPILRPLISFNKQEIISIAGHIGSYDISIQPYKDCCALLSEQPKTRSYAERLDVLEQEILPDYQKLLDKTLADGLYLQYDCGVFEGSSSSI